MINLEILQCTLDLYTDYSDCTPHGQNTGNSTEPAVVFIPVLNPENRILHWNENKYGFGTVFIPPLLGVSRDLRVSLLRAAV
jgi:hypothetical protein